MATTTAPEFRTALKTRLAVTGTEWTDAQIDEAGRAAFNAAFPALYKTVVEPGLAVTQNTTTYTGTVTVTDANRVYELVDSDTDETVRGWSRKDDTIIRRIPYWVNNVDASSYAAINYPADDVTSVTVPDEWLDALYTYAELTLVELLMGDVAPIADFIPGGQNLAGIQANLYNKWLRERDEHAMALPARAL
jgi:hypothetical protein